jgi:F-type H+-transporting ATPase subunit epsilon
MKLSIATPLAIVVDAQDVTYVRAEDETGAFGILPSHADFLTSLSISVVTWRQGEQEEYVAVRGGTLVVRGGDHVCIVTREAIRDERLSTLANAILSRMRDEETSEQASHLAGTRMEMAAMRQIQNYLATGSGRLRQGSLRPGAVPCSEGDVGEESEQ